MFLVILLNFLYAVGYPISKITLQYGSPLFLTALRMLIGGACLIFLQYFIEPAKVRVPAQFMGSLFLSALFNVYLTNALELYGLLYMDPAKTAFLYNLSPFISILLGYIFLNERMSVHKWIGVSIAFIGSFIILGTESFEETQLYHLGFISGAEMALLIAATTNVLGCIVIQRLLVAQYPSMMLNGISMIGGGLMALMHSLLVEPWTPIPSTDFIPFLRWALLMVVLYNFICYELYNRLARYYTVTFLVLSFFCAPLFTALIDWLWLGIIVPWQFWLASFLIFIGLYLFYKNELILLKEVIVKN